MGNKSNKVVKHQENTVNKTTELANLEIDTYTLKDKIDFLFKVIGRFDLYITSTNTKASLIFAWNGIVVGTLLLKYSEIINLFPTKSNFPIIINTIFLATALCAVISNVIAFRVIFPSLKSDSKNENNSIIYFGSVASNSAEVYFDKVHKISDEGILNDITDQAITLAGIAVDKMQKLKISIKTLYLEFYFVGVLFGLKFFAFLVS